MRLRTTEIPGCYQVEYVQRADERGSFIKTFRATTFRELGLEAAFTEHFYSVSREGVVRGMHFQLPPADGAKLVYCLQGAVFDVALDLRVGSPSFGRAVSFELDERTATAAYIPRGVAHGFATRRGPATLVYCVSSEYDPRLDAGVLWSSCGVEWPMSEPLLSPRDRSFPILAEFKSPFRFAPMEASA